jgi:transposase-like protein
VAGQRRIREDQTRLHDLYRAVDKQGKTVESLFQTQRGIAAAMAFFRKAVVACAPRFPRKITLDGNKQSHWGLRRLRREDRRWKYVLVRNSQYLNNIVEPATRRRGRSSGGGLAKPCANRGLATG